MNLQPFAYKAIALPTELHQHKQMARLVYEASPKELLAKFQF